MNKNDPEEIFTHISICVEVILIRGKNIVANVVLNPYLQQQPQIACRIMVFSDWSLQSHCTNKRTIKFVMLHASWIINPKDNPSTLSVWLSRQSPCVSLRASVAVPVCADARLVLSQASQAGASAAPLPQHQV